MYMHGLLSRLEFHMNLKMCPPPPSLFEYLVSELGWAGSCKLLLPSIPGALLFDSVGIGGRGGKAQIFFPYNSH